jgi:hypothetical protein
MFRGCEEWVQWRKRATVGYLHPPDLDHLDPLAPDIMERLWPAHQDK